MLLGCHDNKWKSAKKFDKADTIHANNNRPYLPLPFAMENGWMSYKGERTKGWVDGCVNIIKVLLLVSKIQSRSHVPYDPKKLWLPTIESNIRVEKKLV